MTDRWGSFADLVQNDYDAEWQRKQSIETRALALVTVNIALLTVVTLMSERLGLLDQLENDCIRGLGILSLTLFGLSTVAALGTALPYSYHALNADDLLDTMGELASMNDLDGTLELVEVRIEQLRQARKVNRQRAGALVAGYLAAILAAGAMATAFGLAVHSAPLP